MRQELTTVHFPSLDAMYYYGPIANRGGLMMGGAMPGLPGVAYAMAPSFALRKGSFAPAKAPIVVRKTFPESWLWEDIFEDR